MLNLFPNETKPLTETEKSLVPGFVKSLTAHIDRENAITSREIIRAYRKIGVKLSGPRIRAIIHHIRVNDLVERLIGTPNGYYVTNNPELLAEYIESLEQRSRSIFSVAKALKRQFQKAWPMKLKFT